MQELWEKTGLVLCTNTGLTKAEEMTAVISLLKPQAIVYEGGANKRENIAKNVYDIGTPLNALLHYHHEMAYMTESAEFISFMCMNGPADPRRGATYLSENIGATRDLMNHPSGLG